MMGAVDPWTIVAAISGALGLGIPAVFALGRAFGRIDELHRKLRELSEARASMGARVGDLETDFARFEAMIGRPPRTRKKTRPVVVERVEGEDSDAHR